MARGKGSAVALAVALGGMRHWEPAQSQNGYLEALKSAQRCVGVKGRGQTRGVEYYLGIGVEECPEVLSAFTVLVVANLTFYFSKFRT